MIVARIQVPRFQDRHSLPLHLARHRAAAVFAALAIALNWV